MKQFFKSWPWYFWGGIIPVALLFDPLVSRFGVDPNAGWANVVGWVFVAFQVFCLGFVIRRAWEDHKEHKRCMKELNEEIDALMQRFQKSSEGFIEACHRIEEKTDENKTTSN